MGSLTGRLLVLGGEGDVEHLLLALLGRGLGLVHVLRVEVLEPGRVRVGGRVVGAPRRRAVVGHRVAEPADGLEAGDGAGGLRGRRPRRPPTAATGSATRAGAPARPGGRPAGVAAGSTPLVDSPPPEPLRAAGSSSGTVTGERDVTPDQTSPERSSSSGSSSVARPRGPSGGSLDGSASTLTRPVRARRRTTRAVE